MKDLNALPQEVQEEVKNTLKAFDKVNVIYEYGAYHVTASVTLKKVYAADHEFIGTYKAADVFTQDERIINYVEEFRAYPPAYKGKRDYKWINRLKYGDKVRFDEDGNLISA